MSLSRPADFVRFAYDKIEEDYEKLYADGWLKKSINKAILDIKVNAFCGEPIRKKQVPKKYVKEHGIDNLWWFPLPNGWRLVYSVISVDTTRILALIMEYFDHKNYERRFGYA